MGSHPWKAVTAYEPDVAAALARAQAEVFERGEYGLAHSLKALYAQLGMPAPPLPEEPKARTIEEAREFAGESGTRSVLDVYSIAAAPALMATGSLSSKVLQRTFKTERPSLAQAEAQLGPIFESLERGASAYVVCYENDQPTHYIFLGMSID